MFDSFVIEHVCQQLTDRIVGKRIQKISLLAKDRFSLKFGSTNHLLIDLSSESYHISLLDQKPIDQTLVTGLYTGLRKHLMGAKLVAVVQHDFDRTIELRFQNLNSIMEPVSLSLYLEMMGRHSNGILVDQDGLIIQALKFSNLPSHPIVMGMPYSLFPSAKPLPFDAQAPMSEAMNYKGFNKALLRILPANRMDQTVAQVSQWIMSQAVSCVYQNGSDYTNYHLFRNDELALVETADIFEAINLFYSQTKDHSKTSTVANHRQRIQQRIHQLQDKLILLEGTRTEFETADEFKNQADILYANLYQLEPGQQRFEGDDFLGNRIVIELDAQKTPSQNAQSLYEKYQKMTRGLKSVAEQTELATIELEKLDQLQYDLNHLSDAQSLQEFEKLMVDVGLLKRPKVKPTNQPSKPIEVLHDGIKYVVGRNSLQNEQLISCISHRDHVWFHAKGIPGSHVVMQLPLDQASESQLEFGAKLAASYSKTGPGVKIPVDYVKLSQLKKPKGTPLGFVTFTGQKTIQVVGDPI